MSLLTEDMLTFKLNVERNSFDSPLYAFLMEFTKNALFKVSYGFEIKFGLMQSA